MELVKNEVKLAESDPEVELSELTTNIYVDNSRRKNFIMIDFIRGKLYEESIKPADQRY